MDMFPPQILDTGIYSTKFLLTYLNGRGCVYLFRDSVFNTSYNTGMLILLFYGIILESYPKNLGLGSEWSSSCRDPGNASRV